MFHTLDYGYGMRQPHGAVQMPGRNFASDRHLRRVASQKRKFIHRPKNGHYDVYTYWFIVDALLRADPGEIFTSRDLTEYLNNNEKSLFWDTTVVGRVLTDISDNLNETYDMTMLSTNHSRNGSRFYIDHHDETSRALKALQEDLTRLADWQHDVENRGERAIRSESPLLQCRSVMRFG